MHHREMAARGETYTPGYSANVVDFMARRRAGRDAAFFTPRLRPGMRLLDCGCGPGTMTLDLAALVAPGEVIGVDRELSQVNAALQSPRESSASVRFEAASVYDLPFPDGHFDAVFSHALFEHLGDPAAALNEIKRVLKPGGSIGLRSPDWGGNLIFPLTPLIEEAVRSYKDLQSSNRGDVTAGRKLGSWLRQAGIRRIAVSASYECYEPPSQIAEYLAQQIENATDRHQRGERVASHALAEELRRWSREPGALYAQAWGEAVGVA